MNVVSSTGPETWKNSFEIETQVGSVFGNCVKRTTFVMQHLTVISMNEHC